MNERCKVEMVATVFGFYDPERESLEDAQDRLVIEAEMAVNKVGYIRMHVRGKHREAKAR